MTACIGIEGISREKPVSRRAAATMHVAIGLLTVFLLTAGTVLAEPLVFEGGDGPGSGKRVVLVSGDEEYRSEEALPALAKVLSVHHGFRCTVLFAMSGDTIDPNNAGNIPGLEALESADLMIIATRYRNLPDEQMQWIDRYLLRGGPVIGLRTATHAFRIPADRRFAHYGNDYAGEKALWAGGFGRLVLGEKWIAHHGAHGREATRGVIPEELRDLPILRGCGDIFGPTDVYAVRLPLPGDSRPLVFGAVLAGMDPADEPVRDGRNDPMMPIAWTKTYQVEDGKAGRVFTTTMGAAVDLRSEGLRRLLVNAVYWCTGLEAVIPEQADVSFVGDFGPSPFGFRENAYWQNRQLTPEQFR
jgi:hypothetical protein